MTEATLYETKNHLSAYVAAAEQGVTTIVTKHGKPAALITPLAASSQKKVNRTGFMAAEFSGWSMPENFNEMMQAEILELFGVENG